MPLSTGGRNVLRSIAVGGALVGSLAMGSSAQAALGGAASAHFSNRPNLESVTFNGQVATFRFDKPVQPNGGVALDPSDFTIGGYRAIATNTPTVTPPDRANIAVSDPRNVLVTYSNDAPDFNAATFGAVAGNIVQGYGTFATPNLPDATKLTGSVSESGTRGHTTGPDLQSVAVDLDNNEIEYTFDQDVDDDTLPDDDNFQFIDSNGDLHSGATVENIDGHVVEVRFPAFPSTNRVDQARQAVVRGVGDSVGNPIISNDNPATEAPTANVNIPGRPSLTDRPVLESAVLEPNSNTIVYTFDQPVATADPTLFHGNYSDGVISDGASRTISGNTVRVTFPAAIPGLGPIDQASEHLVMATVENGAVTGAGGTPGPRSGKPIGGNAGAKASGYTTAPDALSATFNRASGQVTVLFDSRIANLGLIGGLIDPNQFVLVSDLGDTVPPAPAATGVAQASNGPTQARVILQYQVSQINAAFPAGGPAGALVIRGSRNVGGDTFTPFGGPVGPAVFGTIPTFSQDNVNVWTNIVPTETTTNFTK
jgi:hypothetical protein